MLRPLKKCQVGVGDVTGMARLTLWESEIGRRWKLQIKWSCREGV